MKFEELIKELREKAGLSLSQMSAKTGLSKSSLSNIENGINSPTVENFNKICDALGIEPDRFYQLHKEINNGNVSYRNGNLIAFDVTNSINNCVHEPTDLGYECSNNTNFKTADEAMKFILNQKSIAAYGDFDRSKLSDEDIVSLANELLEHLKLLGYKYKYKK